MVFLRHVQQRLDVNEDVVDLDDQTEDTIRIELTIIEKNITESEHCDHVMRYDLDTTEIKMHHTPRQECVVNEVTHRETQQQTTT